jgi:hypothetical protein
MKKPHSIGDGVMECHHEKALTWSWGWTGDEVDMKQRTRFDVQMRLSSSQDVGEQAGGDRIDLVRG